TGTGTLAAPNDTNDKFVRICEFANAAGDKAQFKLNSDGTCMGIFLKASPFTVTPFDPKVNGHSCAYTAGGHPTFTANIDQFQMSRTGGTFFCSNEFGSSQVGPNSCSI
ncbi:MAG TPA: hypothetical protein PKA88_25105, partial [Polyangiaceae bacterium]|nr:hypothetical protein [Polyangiaceae bacterium]